MDRRRFLLTSLAGALAAPLAAEAQQAGKVYRIGVLEVVAAVSNAANLSAFKQGLREHGYIEGQNLVIEYQSADGRAERFADLAKELVQLERSVTAHALDFEVCELRKAALKRLEDRGGLPLGLIRPRGGPSAVTNLTNSYPSWLGQAGRTSTCRPARIALRSAVSARFRAP
jgi:hypothetical protein